jgi:hypothetical protein
MPNLTGTSASATTPAVSGVNSAAGDGVTGTGRRGVVGISPSYQGVYGKSTDNAGVVGESDHLHGVFGVCHNPNGAGVYGTNDVGGFGLQGVSTAGRGVTAYSETGSGVYGECKNGRAIEGWSVSNYGVSGDSQTFAGVRGTSISATGTEGWSTSGAGIAGMSQSGVGVYGKGGNLAGLFDGSIQVNGDIKLSNPSGDFAEEFDIIDHSAVSPGTVMVLSEGGALQACSRPYDRRAAGVISGAGEFRPGIVLDRQDNPGRLAIGVVGKVSCRVDASYGPIEIGDLLTTSGTPGHAMKATDTLQAFGAIIGKALRPLASGTGFIPILIALQ